MTDTHQQDPLFELPEAQQVIADLLTVRQTNAAIYEDLLHGGVRPDPAGVVLLKLETLLELALPAEDRNKVELAFERRMTPMLEACVREMREAELTQGITNVSANTLIVPGR